MKPIFIISLLILFTQINFAQNSAVVKYYINYKGTPVEKARAQYEVNVYKLDPNDLLWQRDEYHTTVPARTIHCKGQSKDSMGFIKQGKYVYYNENGKRYKEMNFSNGKINGELLMWNTNNAIELSYHYNNNTMVDDNRSWYLNGGIQDSFMLDEKGNGNGLGYYDDGSLKYAGKFENGIKNGEWIYYFKGAGAKKSMVIFFNADSIVTSNCFDINGNPRTENCEHEKQPAFPGGQQAWVAYLKESLAKVKSEKYLDGKSTYRVIVKYMVNANGEIKDAVVENPAIDKLDKAALNIIKQSPKWNPGIQYGQCIDVYLRQPVTFMVE